ncbi:hypothetical protein [Qipengyuania sp. MTN3-11]|uniref:hypothetical protein n=1 Tax=Qipengyuania sp. MTN3-11 TaxID=3056557 RepID=UPI0036F26AF9
MKPIYAHAGAALALTFTIAACIPAPDSTPVPEPVQRPAPTPSPTPTPSIALPAYDNWIDAPQTPGDWAYRTSGSESRASFSTNDTLAFQMICTPTKQIALIRPGGSAGRIGIRTETSERAVSAESRNGAAVATLSPRDPLLDAMALTRGRFAVETAGQSPLYLPAWAEVTRVIEDCR